MFRVGLFRIVLRSDKLRIRRQGTSTADFVAATIYNAIDGGIENDPRVAFEHHTPNVEPNILVLADQ